MAKRSKRIRNFKQEYQRRISASLAKGLSRSQARGHARAGERPTASSTIDRTSAHERALGYMKEGMSQKAAARMAAVSVESLRRYQKENTTSRREGRRWVILDQRHIAMKLASKGELIDVTVERDAGSQIGRYWVRVDRFLETNNPDHLAAFRDRSARDVAGRLHLFETRPNVLRRMDSVGELRFTDIYSQTVQ